MSAETLALRTFRSEIWNFKNLQSAAHPLPRGQNWEI